MTAPCLILVTGMPGAGKTTLAARLTRDLNVPGLGKDQLKEFLMDTLGAPDVVWSQILGGATIKMLRVLIDHMAKEGKTILIECPFHAEFDGDPLAEVITKRNVRCLEIYCDINEATRRKRYDARLADGKRHPGHFDLAAPRELDAETMRARFAPLHLGDLIRIDTTSFGDDEYAALRDRVQDWLEQ